MMEDKIATVETIIKIHDDVFYAIRDTCEKAIKQCGSFHPMLTFFSSEDKIAATIVVTSHSNFEDTLMRISEAMYLYPPLKAHAVMIAINSDIHDEFGQLVSSSLNVFSVSEEYCFITTMPYVLDSERNLQWYTEQFETSNVLDKNFEGISKEMVNLFFMFTHIDSAPYTVQEVLSYLTFAGASINLDEKMPMAFYDMTPK